MAIGLLIERYTSVETARIETEAAGLARTLAVALDREFDNFASTLQALATSPHLRTDDLAAFHGQASELGRQLGQHFSLRDRDGVTIMTTRLPFGTLIEQLPAEVRDVDARVLATGKPQISDIYVGPVTGRPNVTLAVPVLSDDPPDRVVGASIDLEVFVRAIERFDPGPMWTIGVLDRQNRFVARYPGHAEVVGKPAPIDYRTSAGSGRSVYYGTNSFGVPALVAWHPSAATGWQAAATLPRAMIDDAFNRSAAYVVIIAMLLGGLGFGLSWIVQRRLRQTFGEMVGYARAIGSGSAPPPPVTGVVEVNEIGKALASAARDLKVSTTALRESEERLRGFATSNVIGMVYTDPAGVLTSANDEFLRIVGRTRSELTSGALHWDRLTPARWRDIDREQMADAQARGSSAPYEKEFMRPDGTATPVLVGYAVGDSLGMRVGFVLDITARKELEERQQLLIRELHHRVKNTLATVLAIMSATLRSGGNLETFADAFAARVLALGRSHALLADSAWDSAALGDLFQAELAPYRDGSRAQLSGPPVRLRPRAALAVGMAAHELVTNAAKHGALSVPEGRVDVSWEVMPDGAAANLRLTWREENGPPVKPPAWNGFGSRMLQKVLATEINGHVRTDFAESGVVVEITGMIEPADGTPVDAVADLRRAG